MSQQDPQVIQLQSVSDITIVGELKEQLASALANQQPITIEAAEVERIDAACLQLLVAYFNTLNEKDIRCTWGATSDAVRDAARLCGVEKILGLAEAA